MNENTKCDSCGGSSCGNCEHGGNCGKCGCMHHSMGPILTIIAGLVLLLTASRTLPEIVVMYAIPVLIIIWGATRLMGKKCKCC